MSAKLISTAPNLASKPNQSSKIPIPRNISSISFNFRPQNSRIFLRNPSGPWRARVQAHYAPAETLYELLGIAERGSSVSDIKKAYKKMARKYHPDVSPPDRVDEYTRRFIMVHDAYETLSDPESRASYDRALASGSGSGSGFAFSARKPRRYYQEMERKEEWKTRWRSQLDELKRRKVNRDSKGRMSSGA